MTGRTEAPQNHVYAVILAGGSGTRFWPKSRHLKPKQLCQIGNDDKTMIELTLDRIDGFIPPERRVIVTHEDQMEATRKIVGDRCAHLIAEPDARNTANALALAALHINAVHDEDSTGSSPIMVSLHADHQIRDGRAFRSALLKAIDVAENGLMTLLGIVPRYPETGYGYIERGYPIDQDAGTYRVASFREKPDADTASRYVETGQFYWNAGLFIWKNTVLLEELKTRLPESVSGLEGLVEPGRGFPATPTPKMTEVYKKLPKISIDNAVLEVSDNVAVVDADIGWQDVGSWDALTQCFPTDARGNLSAGDVWLQDCDGTTVDTDGPFVAAIGLRDMVVVSSGDAVLVCPRDRAQEVKKVVEWLKENDRKDLL